MSNKTTKALAVLIALLVIFAAAVTWMAISGTRRASLAEQRIGQLEKKLAVSGTSATTVPASSSVATHPLARAMQLLSSTVNVTSGYKISGNYYWVSAEAPGIDNENNRKYQSWVVDLGASKARLARETVYGVPVVYRSPRPYFDDSALEVVSDAGWEGANRRDLEVFIGQEDVLLATVEQYNLAPLTKIARGSKTLSIEFAPKDACRDATKDKTVALTGLLVDGKILSFKKPHTATCDYNEFLGAAFLPEFGQASYERTADPIRDLIEFTLPWGSGVTVDLANLSAEGVTVRD